MKLQDVFSVLTADEVLVASKGDLFTAEYQDSADNFVVVYDKQMLDDHHTYEMKRVYRVRPDGDLDEVPITKMITEIIPKIESSFDGRKFLESVLKSSGPHTVEQLHKLVNKHPEVASRGRAKAGCYMLDFENPEPGKDSISLYLRV